MSCGWASHSPQLQRLGRLCVQLKRGVELRAVHSALDQVPARRGSHGGHVVHLVHAREDVLSEIGLETLRVGRQGHLAAAPGRHVAVAVPQGDEEEPGLAHLGEAGARNVRGRGGKVGRAGHVDVHLTQRDQDQVGEGRLDDLVLHRVVPGHGEVEGDRVVGLRRAAPRGGLARVVGISGALQSGLHAKFPIGSKLLNDRSEVVVLEGLHQGLHVLGCVLHEREPALVPQVGHRGDHLARAGLHG